ncbi:peptidoglycan DD-metalloendopeptidase family protein [Gracilimonas sp.]|uniref:peptidoglycan DD-metalloendopeptidase family protein n=1 Tax=Gracilimonas sp. TaxID=1974203 RepID=UPI003BACFDEA
MKLLLLFITFLVIANPLTKAQDRIPDGGGLYEPPTDHMTEEMRTSMIGQLQQNIDSLRAVGRISAAKTIDIKIGWPLRGQDHLFDFDYHGVSNFVDLNNSFPNQITDYTCGSRSYDLDNGYNHAGTDFFTWPFAWNKVQGDDVAVVAAAPGVIIQKIDGNQDQSCSFNGTQWNAVYVRHSDGSVAWYGHLKTNSTTEKNVGDNVEEGEYLGIVGSSGNSTGPHLHFELHDENGTVVDPFEGACNSIDESLWHNQRDYYDSSLNALRTHGSAPVLNQCPTPDIPNFKDAFLKGDQIVNAIYFRDQLEGQTAFYSVVRPSGQTLWSWSHSLSEIPHYSASYWYWQNDLPVMAEEGVWEFRVSFLNEIYTHQFTVSDGNTKPIQVHLQNPENDTEITGNEVILRWLPLADADEYELEIAAEDEFSEIIESYELSERDLLVSELTDGENYFWRVRAKNSVGTGDWSETGSFNTGVSTSVTEPIADYPDQYRLHQNFPNPFNPTTQIRYVLPKQTMVKLAVYNVLGQEVSLLVNKVQNRGDFQVTFDASGLPSGIYYLKLQTVDFTEVKPMTLIK